MRKTNMRPHITKFPQIIDAFKVLHRLCEVTPIDMPPIVRILQINFLTKSTASLYISIMKIKDGCNTILNLFSKAIACQENFRDSYIKIRAFISPIAIFPINLGQKT